MDITFNNIHHTTNLNWSFQLQKYGLGDKNLFTLLTEPSNLTFKYFILFRIIEKQFLNDRINIYFLGIHGSDNIQII